MERGLSLTVPLMTVVPSLSRRIDKPSNRLDQRASRWPSTRISYALGVSAVLRIPLLSRSRLAANVVSRHRQMW